MTIVRIAALTLFVASGAGSAALASPTTVAPIAATPIQTVPVVYGYGPNAYGIYGHRRHRYGARHSFGTGYHGRGTATGGPVGGLPSRN